MLARTLINNLMHLVKASSKDGLLPQLWKGATKKQVCVQYGMITCALSVYKKILLKYLIYFILSLHEY